MEREKATPRSGNYCGVSRQESVLDDADIVARTALGGKVLGWATVLMWGVCCIHKAVMG